MLTEEEALTQVRELVGHRNAESASLDTIRRYWRGRQELPAVIPRNAPREVHTLARIARVNVCEIVIDAMAQSMYVDGYRGRDDDRDAEVWNIWQANKMDARQTGLHRATFAYGVAYAIVLPGDPLPVIRTRSPRQLTAVYGEDQDWPVYALERLGRGRWRLFDDEGVYVVQENSERETSDDPFVFVEARRHDLGVTPVIRFLDEDDLDIDDEVESESGLFGDKLDIPMLGQIVQLMPVQDQIDLTTFGLLVAQHYAAFKQRYIIGWTTDDENEQMQTAANRLWTFDENPDEVKVGELGETDLSGYIESREASMRHAATLTQTPVHELLGQMINLSAEALVAAEKGRDRKVDERKALLGESHEQMLQLCARAANMDVPDDAEVRWRDTSARAFSATVDALGKLAQMLNVPPQELWERIPGVTRQDIQRWKAAAEAGDSFDRLADLLNRQASDRPAFNGADG